MASYAAVAGAMDGGFWFLLAQARTTAVVMATLLLCLLPPFMNVQRGEGRSLRLPFISLFLLMKGIF